MSVKRVLFLSSLLGATLFAQDVGATLVRMLPESSHYQGHTFYDEEWPDGFDGINLLRGRIDFAVYDTLVYPNEFIGDGGYTAPGDGQYIYAYQIINEYPPDSQEAVAYFSVLGIDMANVDIISIGSQEDPESIGVKPSPVDTDLHETGEYFTETDAAFTETDAVWEFGTTSWDWINIGDHSWFLVFSSDMDWSRGEYEIRGSEEGVFPGVPEPATLTSLLIGGAILFRRRRNIHG